MPANFAHIFEISRTFGPGGRQARQSYLASFGSKFRYRGTSDEHETNKISKPDASLDGRRSSNAVRSNIRMAPFGHVYAVNVSFENY